MEASAVLSGMSKALQGAYLREKTKEIIHISLKLNGDSVRHAYIEKGQTVQDAICQVYKKYTRNGGIVTIDKKTGVIMFWVNDILSLKSPDKHELYENDSFVRLKFMYPNT